MRLAIVGSRDYTNYNEFKQYIDRWISKNGRPKLIVSGGAQGADKLAEQYARANVIKTQIFKADWQTYGRAAGPMRNTEIVDNSDAIIAFVGPKSVGTLDTIQKAKLQNKLVKIINVEC